MSPFKVVPEGNGWCVVIHHPQDENDFVVADRSKMERDAHLICDALNRLIEAHMNEEKNETLLFSPLGIYAPYVPLQISKIEISNDKEAK